jgi:hypothetical protein
MRTGQHGAVGAVEDGVGHVRGFGPGTDFMTQFRPEFTDNTFFHQTPLAVTYTSKLIGHIIIKKYLYQHSPPLFPIIIFGSTTLFTGMTGISLHM